MGTLFVDKLDPQSGTSLELGSSGDTVSVNASATTNLPGNVTLGANGKTIAVPSGATLEQRSRHRVSTVLTVLSLVLRLE